ncbi:MAG: glycosyltransferase family 4 protein [Mariprofundaceae bacterium]|nr:glycosyltransferase family 4 protein [Mariprofundaceae bacterium]
MRILHLITRMDGGGSAVNTLLCSIGQQQAGHQVTLAAGPSEESQMTGSEQGQLAERMRILSEAGGVIVTIPAMMRSPGLLDYAAYRQIRQLIQQGFDIIHTHTSKAGTLGRLAARGSAAAVVHTPHGHIFHGYFGWLMTSAFITIERRLARRCDALVALTAAERDDHLALGIGRSSQWRIIPSGVDVDLLAREVDQWRSGHEGQLRWDAVSVGRLTHIKGMDRLLRAWAALVREQPDVRLAIVGDGGDRQMLEGMCQDLGLQGNVHFAGWADPVPYLAASRSFALLSHNEGMGRAVVEAFAAGLPCVVADVCGLRELVTDACGVVLDADDPQAVAGALQLMRSTDALAACRERAQSYSLQSMLEQLMQLYCRLRPDAA